MNDSEEDQPRKKRRGPYMQWLHNPNRPIPESTLRSRRKKPESDTSGDIAEGENQHQPLPVNIETGHDGTQEVEARPPTNQPPDLPNEPAVAVDQATCQPNIPAVINDADDRDLGADTDCQRVDYIRKYNLNSLLHRDFAVSKLETLLMILFLAVRHCHTQSFIEAQILFVNTLFGEEVLDISYHIFQGVFPASKSIVKHYFCPDCQLHVGCDRDLVGLKEVECKECKKRVKVNNVDAGNFFVTLSMREQIKALLERPDIKLVNHASQSGFCIADIFDGRVFQRCKELGISIEDILTITANSDGVRVFDSTPNTMYPIIAHLNEISPEQRFKVDNSILCGLWFGKSAPTMSLFMKPFMDEVLDLSTKGLKYRQPDGKLKQVYVFPLACSFDSIAKPKVTCQKQFNAYHGCPYCLDPNDVVEPGETLRHYNTRVTFPVRTEESVITDMYSAHRRSKRGTLKKEESVNGFIGLSILMMFSDLLLSYPRNTFHIVWSVVIDYMHCVLEGVTADLLAIYLNLLDANQIKTLNERMESIALPQGMTRKPRPITEKVHWKAKEYRAFLLYYALPCLNGLLPAPHFALLKLLVNAMHILLGDSISIRALNEAKEMLSSFVPGFQRLYGLENVTFNLHLLTHLCDQVFHMGPLWCYSNFIFESCNGRLVKLVKGTRSVVNEISKKFSRLQVVPTVIQQNVISDKVLEFGNSILGYKYLKQGNNIDGNFITGSHSIVSINADEYILFESHSIPIVNNSVQFYHRVISKGLLFYSYSYSKAKAFNDSCVQLTNGTYALIDKILISSTNNLLCLIIPIRIAGSVIPPIKICAYDCYDSVKIVPFSDVAKKCVFISFETKVFICDLPNNYERD